MKVSKCPGMRGSGIDCPSYCITLYCIILYFIVLHCIVLDTDYGGETELGCHSYCITLCCIILYFIVLHCIVLDTDYGGETELAVTGCMTFTLAIVFFALGFIITHKPRLHVLDHIVLCVSAIYEYSVCL